MPFLKLLLRSLTTLSLLGTCADAAQSPYSHGDPTAYEQLMLELVNRARTDPLAEAARYGLLDLNQGLVAGSISAAPKQPLAFNPFLIASSRGHSQWMIDADTFSHTGLNGSTPTGRMEAAGYYLYLTWGTGENIAGHFSTFPGNRTLINYNHHEGLFLSPVHRVNILAPGFDEIGIGELEGAYKNNGTTFTHSSLLTQNFAYSWGSPVPDGAFLTGVVYADTDGDGFYTPGEGLAGVEIRPATGSWYAVSSSSGGYALPVGFAGGELSISLNGNGFANTRTNVALPGGVNVKADFIPGVTVFPDPLAAAIAHPDGWYVSAWYGWFTRPHPDWIHHATHGFQYYRSASGGGVYFYDAGLQAWYWTSASCYPAVYILGAEAGWYVLSGASAEPVQ